jgi:hypothetical protein
LRLRGRKKEDAEENFTVKSFMIGTPRCTYGEGTNFFRILVGKHEAKKQLGRPKYRREDKISSRIISFPSK